MSHEAILLIILMIGWFFVSYNSGLISGTLKLIISEFKLSSTESGLLLSSWLLGMLLGASIMGYISDKIGRKKTLLINLLILGFFSFLSSLSHNLLELILVRFIAGISASGYMVVASVLLSEFVGKTKRGLFVVILESSWALGWLASLIITRIFIVVVNWREIFYTSLMTLSLIPIFLFGVPESYRFLISKGYLDEAKEIVAKYNVDVNLHIITSSRKKHSIFDLFDKNYRKRTIMLWIHWFCIVLAYWGMFLWLPTILSAKGLSFIESIEYAIIITTAQIPGYLSVAYLIEKLGRKYTLSLYMILGGLGSLLFWYSNNNLILLLSGILVSFFNLGAWGATYTYTPELYPTDIRGFASGWANSIGRIGGFLGPNIVGYMMALTGDPLYPFLVFAMVHFISGITVCVLGIETKGKELEEISR